MAKRHSSREDVNRVIAFAQSLGFSVDRTNNRHFKFTRSGLPTVFFSSTPADCRAWLNGISKLRRAAAGGVA